MNDESLNISFARGKVNQVGYPDSECIFVKPLENRHDEFKDKALYVVSNDYIKSPFFVVTPNVLEALGRVEKKSLGIIKLDGEIVVPMNNSSITNICDNYFACNRSNSSTELDVVKSDPTKAGENASISNSIKNQMNVMAKKELNYVSGDFYSQNDIYEISDNKVTKLFSDMSFIAYNDDNIYLHSNNLLDDVVLVKEELKKDDSMNIETSSAVASNISVESSDVKQESVLAEEKNKDVSENVSSNNMVTEDIKSTHDDSHSLDEKISMPVEKFTNILEKSLDSLNVVNTALVKEDAPKLIEEDSDKTVENSEKIISSVSFDLEDKKDDISSKNNRKSVFLEDTEVEKFNSNRNKDNDDALVVVPQLVGAIREKLSNNEEKIEKRDEMIEKLRSENSSKDMDIRKLKERLSLFTQKFSAQEDKIASLKRNVTSIKDENDKLKDKNASLLSENDELKEKNSNLIDENNELRGTVHNIVEEFSGLINNSDSEVNYGKVA